MLYIIYYIELGVENVKIYRKNIKQILLNNIKYLT